MKIVYIGYNIQNIYQKYAKGDISSHLLYGAVELGEKGLIVDYYSQSKNGLKGIIQDIINLKKEKADILFFPYIGGTFYLFLALAKKLGFLKKEKLMGILHNTPQIKKSNAFYIKSIYKVFNKIYFHSPKNREECVNKSIISLEQSEILKWGTNLSYIRDIKNPSPSNNRFFISTGLENRDFDTLIKAFSAVPDKELQIFVYNNFLTNLKTTENIKINHIDQRNSTQHYIVQQTMNAQCVVIPINNNGLTYCTGHTSIVEAMALGKAIIVTDNPYHPIDVEKESIGIKVKPNDITSWIKAIQYIDTHESEVIRMGGGMEES